MKLRIENLTFSYEGNTVVDRLSLDIKDGEFVSLLGPSGCGKSTVLKLLTGILTPRSGSILVDGQAVNGVSERFAYMPQDDLLFPWKTILDNVCLYGQIHGSLSETRRKALSWFPLFGLEGYEHAYPASLSGGMRQRAAFLRTALCRADILLLDEPFGALDVITRGEMQDWLLLMREQMKKTVLLVTHDMDEAIYLSDRILILNPPPDGLSAALSVSASGRNREWLYSQSALRAEIYSKIRRRQTAAAVKGEGPRPL
ncbi:ABC transporter ATP-binding protein [Otoolea muris]|uniref:ABC transporter ATP-binding protein n=1 Tax=Otoolea muris TaxID=2941515 RepID=UPI00203E3973|nr:ABC transporter ATP-binding protein [Otoolea muris]